MSFKKWLLTTVITGGLVAASCGGALAQSGKLLHPNSGWAVSKLAASGAEPYCALARRFNGNIILTMARNGSDESSVAIDFQKQALDNKQSYAVTLDPGFQQFRSYSVRPVSGKAMVVRLGQDYAFLDALNRSGKLTVDISGEEYSFHLPDFAEGQSEMAGCLAGLVEPAAGNSARTAAVPTPMPAVPQQPVQQQALAPQPVQQQPVPAPVSSEPVSLKAPVAQQYAQATNIAPVPAPVRAVPVTKVSEPVTASSGSAVDLQNLREENTRLRNALERERRVYEDRFMKEGQSSSQVAELSERLQILERENSDLRQQINNKPMAEATQAPSVLSCETDTAAAEEAAASSAAMASMASEMDALKLDNERLKREIQEQQAEMALLEQQIVTASAAAPTADAEEIAAKEAIIDRLNGRVKTLEEENSALKTAQRQEAGGSSVSLAQLRSLEEQLRYTQEDRDKLAKEVAAMRDGKGDELMSISSSNWNLEQATQRYNEAEKEIRRLSRQLQDQRTQCAGEKKELEYMLFDPDVAEEAQISRLIHLENQLDDISTRFAEQESRHEIELDRLKATKSASDELKAKVAALQSSLTSLQKDKAEFETERKSLEGKIAALQTKNSSEKAAVVAERDDLLQKVARLEAETSRVQASGNAEREELLQKIAKLEAQSTHLKDITAAEREDLAKQMTTLEAKYTNENAQLIAERDQLKQRIGLLQAQVSQGESVSEAERQELTQKISQLEAQYSQEKETIAAERDKLQEQVEFLEAQASQADSITDAQRQEMSQKMSQLEAQYERENEIIAAERDELLEQVASLEAALSNISTAAGAPQAATSRVSAPEPVKAEPISVSSSRPSRAPVDMASAGPSAVDYENGEKTALYGNEAPSSVPSTVGQAMQAASSPAANVNFGTVQDIGRILGQAQIPVQGAVKDEAIDGGKAFSWDTGSLFGSSEEKPMDDIGQFDNMAQAYLVKTKGRCGGEFAAVPVMSDQNGSIRVSAYDIACIGENAGASASILFYNKDGIFHAYAHETGLDSMDLAMDARDKLMKVLLGSDIALK
ncbi:MAG TPA: hypothetical protein EYQ41_12300 [Micavibrio sp.]|nr:hypothetical protein [Micavibrio sp.]